MARNEHRQPIEKTSADCPHCGFSQLESAFAKTTICRKCGRGYSIDKLLLKEAQSLKAPSLFSRLGQMMSRVKEREISCFSCGASQIVSTDADSSMCSKCGSYIDIRDFNIAGPFGRSIQTQGHVEITEKGDVSSARVACGSATIYGKLRGYLVCTGLVKIRSKGEILGDIQTDRIIIEKKSDLLFHRVIFVREIEIHGKVIAELRCDGKVTISKTGHFEGAIFAKSIAIEKGGIFSGDLCITDQGGEYGLPPDGEEEGSSDEFHIGP